MKVTASVERVFICESAAGPSEKDMESMPNKVLIWYTSLFGPSSTYMQAPLVNLTEYMQSGRVTEKSDVYSYGVVLLELLSGRRSRDPSFVVKGLNIVGWVNTLMKENKQKRYLIQNVRGVPWRAWRQCCKLLHCA